MKIQFWTLLVCMAFGLASSSCRREQEMKREELELLALSNQLKQVRSNLTALNQSPANEFTNWFKMNPYPVLSSAAQSLRYPPGIDTAVYWGNGRFAIVLGDLIDNDTNPSRTLCRSVDSFRHEGTNVVLYASGNLSYLNLSEGNYKAGASAANLSNHEMEMAVKLRATNSTGNFRIKNDRSARTRD